MKQRFNRLLAMCLVVVTVLVMTVTASAEDYTSGGYALSTANQTVRQSNSASSAAVGTLYSFEGFTILYSVGYNLFIDYSTPSGNKQGFLVNPQVDWRWTDTSAAAYVTLSSDLYYGPNRTNFAWAGAVYTGEYVAVLAANSSNGWAYVEYNTSAGRKRGYMPIANLTIYNSRTYNGTVPVASSSGTYSGAVRSGPGDNYPKIDTLSNKAVKRGTQYPLYSNYVYEYIEYTDSSGRIRGGYISFYD